VLYFLGISGSGKDTFVSLLEQILGEENEYIAKPSANEFIEKHNGWLIDKYFAQLDEYGDQLQIFSQKQEALGKIKSYTGKKVIQIRQMRADGYALKHAITFILTANTNPLVIDENDRRILLIETPNILREADWIQAEGGMTLVIDKLQTEIKDFAYYLATEVEALAMDEYNNPPLSGSKVRLIAQMLQPADKLIFSLKHQLVESILDMIEEADFNPFDSIKDVSENGLHELLINAYPDQQISKKSLSIAIKKYGINKLPTTRSGVKDYRCIFSTVSSALIKREFEDQETDSGNAINSMPEI
jgi:energy-coupling factor transporter ATP-binding protein EcfA2